jgi:hypothetical protein
MGKLLEMTLAKSPAVSLKSFHLHAVVGAGEHFP